MIGMNIPVRRHCRGFTLVEMLIVVGVVVLLLSILMPTMGRVREQSRRVQCLNNLRQLAVTAIAYASDDENGYFILPDYANFNEGDNFMPWYPKYVTDLKMFVCPSTANVVRPPGPMFRDLDRNAPNGAQDSSGGHSYELRNFYHTGMTFPDGVTIPRGSGLGAHADHIPKRLKGGPNVKSARIMLFTDADDSTPIGDVNNWPDKLPDGRGNDNHGAEGFNCGFMDGRAEWLPTGKPILQAYMDGYYNPSVGNAIMNRYGLYLNGTTYRWQ
jgi:prepilin-type N-terminal cleavage/methylation domain-containing protein